MSERAPGMPKLMAERLRPLWSNLGVSTWILAYIAIGLGILAAGCDLSSGHRNAGDNRRYSDVDASNSSKTNSKLDSVSQLY